MSTQRATLLSLTHRVTKNVWHSCCLKLAAAAFLAGVQQTLGVVPVSASPVDLAQATARDTGSFPNKPINWIVHFGPGGGFDIHTRATARAMREVLGHPVIVKNIPGAGGRVGTNAIFRAKPDGYTIGVLNLPGLIVDQLYVQPPPPYKVEEFEWVGRISTDTWAMVISAKSPYRKLEELRSAPRRLFFAAPGIGASSWVAAVLTRTVMKLPMEIVLGYETSPAIMRAIVQGEADMYTASLGSPGLFEFISRGDVIPLWVYAPKRDPRAPDVPSVAELGFPDLAGLGVHRVVVAPPKTPAERLKILREAFVSALERPETVQVFERIQAERAVLGGDKFVPVLNDLFKLIRGSEQVFRDALK